MSPQVLTVDEIDNELNIEVRRVLIERFGEESYFLAGNLQLVDDDPDFGVLLFRPGPEDDELFLMVKVTNSTPEPDGTRKIYYLRVPPDTQTAQEAVAWTFSIQIREYRPDIET